MGTTAPREKKDRSRHWQRAATRAAMLAAARRLMQRGEVERLSLTAVAREADFAPTTVFAYFANKNDVLLAVLADDLARFAATMREVTVSGEACIGPPDTKEDTAHPHDTPPDPAPTPEQTRAKLRVVERSEPPTGVELPAEVAAAPAPVSAPTPSPEPARETAMLETIVHELGELREVVARIEARPVDQWLERRLREFERGLAALESRPERAETASAQAAVEESMRIIVGRLDGVEARQAQAANDVARVVRDRSEQVERRLREELSEIEAAHARDRARINALENAAFAVAPEFFAAKPTAPAKTEVVAKPEVTLAVPDALVVPAPAAAPAAAESVHSETPAEARPDDAPKPAGADGSFLAAARRSARAAEEQRNAEPHARARTKRLTKRTLYAIAAGLGLVVVLIWVEVYFKALAVTASPAAAATHPSVYGQSAVAVRHLRSARVAPDARTELAKALKLLDGTPKNDAQAADLLSDAAQRGDAFAAFKLATLYRDARGVPADAAKAFHWFDVAAGKGNLKAMQSLAVVYAEGLGTTKDAQEAARWFTRAASMGLTDAQFNLGVLYERGLGVPQSLTDAYKWYLVAATQGDEESRSRVEALKSQLDASDLAAAEEAAASFRAAPADRGANVAPLAVQSPAG